MRHRTFVALFAALIVGTSLFVYVWFRLTSTPLSSNLGAIDIGIAVAVATTAWGSLFAVYWPARPRPSSKSPAPSIAGIDEVVTWGWDGPRLLDELIRLDYETIDGLTVTHEGHRQQWAPVFMDHPDTWRLLIEGPEKIVGYWHFVPLFDQEFALAMDGKLLDSSITTDKVRFFEIPGAYRIYFVSICVEARLRHTSTVRILFESLYAAVSDLARNGVFIEEVCANAYTPSGEAVCRSFGMNYVKEHIDHGRIFARRVFPFRKDDPFTQSGELARMYSEKFSPVTSPDTATGGELADSD